MTAPFRITVTIEAPAELVEVAERLVGTLAGLHDLLACLDARYQAAPAVSSMLSAAACGLDIPVGDLKAALAAAPKYQRGGDEDRADHAPHDRGAAKIAEGHAGEGLSPAPPVTEAPEDPAESGASACSPAVTEPAAPKPKRQYTPEGLEKMRVNAAAMRARRQGHLPPGALAPGHVRLNDVPSVARRMEGDVALAETAQVTWPDAETWAQQHAPSAMATEDRRDRLAIINSARRGFLLPPFSIIAERPGHGAMPRASLG